MKIGRALVVAAVVGVCVVGLGALPASAVELAADEDNPCMAEASSSVDRELLLLGEGVTLTFNVRTLCAAWVPPVNIVFAMDVSEAAGRHQRETRGALVELIRDLNLDETPYVRIGVAAASSTELVSCPLTNSEHRITQCIGRLDWGGAPQLHDVIDAGLDLLIRDRRSMSHPEQAYEALLVVSGSPLERSCPTAMRSSDKAKKQFVLVMTLCTAEDCHVGCMTGLATSRRYAFTLDDLDLLTQAFVRFGPDLFNVWVRAATIRSEYPTNVELELGTASQAGVWDASERSVRWTNRWISREGFTVTMRVRPLVAGRQVVLSRASLVMTNTLGDVLTMPLEPQSVLALSVP